MTDHDDDFDDEPLGEDSTDDDFVLDLIRGPEAPQEVPDNIWAMRALRSQVQMPTGVPSVQEVLLNPSETADQPRFSPGTVRRLMRAQLRLGVSLMSWFLGLVFAGNIAFHFSPALASVSIASLPFEWLFPVIVCIPLLLFLGWFYVRRATSNEQAIAPEPSLQREATGDA